MKCYLFYNRNTAGERATEALAARLDKEERVPCELIDADSPAGIQLAQTYDIMGRPAALVTKDDGTPVQVWQGEEGLPMPSEIAFLVRQ